MEFSQQNKNSIKLLFNQIAQNYDVLNNLMSFGLQNKIKEKAVLNAIKKSSSQDKILDLCTGTGDIAILFQKYCPKSEIVGVDFSVEMLKIAQSRTNNITFIEKDITALGEISQAPFDICFISFGLRNLPNIDEFLENIKPYLKEKGIISILDLGKPNLLMKPYFFFHYEVFIPLLARIFHKDISPYKYFTQSAKTYPSQKELMQKLQNHGFCEIENKNFSFGIISQQLVKLKNN